MVRKTSIIIGLILFIGLFVHLKTFATGSPLAKITIPPISAGNTQTTTFTIRAGNGNDLYDEHRNKILKANTGYGHSIIRLNSSLNDRTAELPVGTYISLHFPGGEYKVTINPNKGIVEFPENYVVQQTLLPRDDIALLKVVGQGTAIISVTRTRDLMNLSQDLAASQTGNWAGYETYTGPDTSITANWVVPTAAYSPTASYSAQWVGIDDGSDANTDIIQVATESNYVTGISCADYLAVYELYPSPPVTINQTVCPGDNMYAKIYKISGSTWSITLNDLTRGWNFTQSVTYYGPGNQGEWIVESQGTPVTELANYGSTSFVNDTLNGANPNHNYSTNSIDMVYGSTPLTIVSQPNSNKNGFTAFYCDPINGCPSTYPPGGWTNEGQMYWTQNTQQSVLLPDGKVLIAGGVYSNMSTKHTQLYTDGSPGSWAAKANLNQDRKYFIMQPVTISGGGSRVLAAGGVADNGGGVRNTAELFNESANTWTYTSTNMNAARFRMASSILSDGRVLVTGGTNNANETTQLTSTEIYDPVANTWTSKAALDSCAPSPSCVAREQHLQVTFTDSSGNSKVMVIGGYKYGTGVLKTTEIYDPSADTWSAGPTMTYARNWTYNPPNAIVLHDGRILVVGGDYTKDSEVYNPSTNSWTTYTTPTTAWGGVATLLGSGANYRVLYAGSFDTSNYKTAMLFDPSANSWSTTTNMNYAHGSFTLVTLNNGNALAAGGQGSSSNETNYTEEYTP